MFYINNFFQELVMLTNEMSPYIILGFFFAGILHVYIRKERIQKYLGKRDLKSVIYASLLGIPLPLCSCGVIPTGISFYKDGASKGATVSFLISTPQTGIDSILVTYSLLGLPFTIIRPIVAFFTGILGGVITNSVDKKDILKIADIACSCDETSDKKGNRFLIALNYGFGEFLREIAEWLVIGLVLAAIIAVVIPDNFFSNYIGNDYLSMLMILVASIPLYVCATASVPIAAVLLLKGLSPGAALIFLMAGPATNVATMTVIGNTLGRKTLFSYLLSIIGGAVICGILIDTLLPRNIFYDNIAIVSSKHASHLLPDWLKITSSILLVVLIIKELAKKYLPSGLYSKSKSDKPGSITITVTGMTCMNCVSKVKTGLETIDCVDRVEVSMKDSEAIIYGENIDMDKINEKVKQLGFS